MRYGACMPRPKAPDIAATTAIHHSKHAPFMWQRAPYVLVSMRLFTSRSRASPKSAQQIHMNLLGCRYVLYKPACLATHAHLQSWRKTHAGSLAKMSTKCYLRLHSTSANTTDVLLRNTSKAASKTITASEVAMYDALRVQKCHAGCNLLCSGQNHIHVWWPLSAALNRAPELASHHSILHTSRSSQQ